MQHNALILNKNISHYQIYIYNHSATIIITKIHVFLITVLMSCISFQDTKTKLYLMRPYVHDAYTTISNIRIQQY